MVTIIHGPRACGKTRNADVLRIRYGAAVAIDLDDFNKRSDQQRRALRINHVLILTDNEGQARAQFPKGHFVAFSETGLA